MKRATFVLVGSLAALGCGDDASSGTGAGGSASGGEASVGGSGTTSSANGAASQGGGANVGGGAPSCPSCEALNVVGSLSSNQLNEVSGIAASADHAGVYYVHNDSGDTPRFFAIDAEGALMSTITVTGASAQDWEDMARGPCVTTTGSCLYFGDFGDNGESRTDYVVYRIAEPETLSATLSVAAEAFPFAYPDGSHNAEALLVHPITGALTIVTKKAGAAVAYEIAPLTTPGRRTTATKVGDVELPNMMALVTGADTRPDGRAVLLRTYTGVYFFGIGANESVAQALLGDACEVPFAIEPQGEAVAWKADGSGYLTVSEGVSAAVNGTSCTP